MDKGYKKLKVGIFTTFSNFDASYSLVSVVKDQLVMHVKHGYDVVLFVLPHFEGSVPEGVEVRKVIPAIIIEPYKGMGFPDRWREDAEEVKLAIEEHAKDIDYAICHDWIFIDTFIPYNIGMREAKLSFHRFHWIHSAPSPRPNIVDNPHANRYELPPMSTLVYLNHDKALALAEMYGVGLDRVRVVPNSIDPRTLWEIDDTVRAFIDKFDLLSADVVSVFPVSTPRMIEGKQIDVVVDIHAELRKLGLSTRLIVPNAHCTQDVDRKLVTKVLDHAKSRGLTEYEVVFTSQNGFDNGIPRKAVSDFFRLANVFIFPSISENCSLILHEAQISGNLLVLNKDCSGLQEFGGENALYFKFGNLDMGIRNYHNDIKNPVYISDIAKIIKSELTRNKALCAKSSALKRFNLDATFRKIEDLYYEVR